ncbi:MAG: amino acid ABC transporter substrate-binding protein [Verrucomicrobia bacterium]|nr:amino acid ABC transporter substrate-binding protein [Verrucomicrobiota bacterium]
MNTTVQSPAPQQLKQPKRGSYDELIEEVERETMEYRMIEETPELLAAIDEGLESLKKDGSVPFEVVKAALKKKWDTL